MVFLNIAQWKAAPGRPTVLPSGMRLLLREPPPPAHNAQHAGIDLTLIDATLDLSVIERIRQNDRAATTAHLLRAAFEAHDDRIPSPRAR